MNEGRFWGIFWLGTMCTVVLVALILALLLWSIPEANGLDHHAADHWYDQDCCDRRHCRPVSCSELTQNEDRSYTYQALTFRQRIRRSQDSFCHVCIVPPSSPMCLYLPGEES